MRTLSVLVNCSPSSGTVYLIRPDTMVRVKLGRPSLSLLFVPFSLLPSHFLYLRCDSCLPLSLRVHRHSEYRSPEVSHR